MKGKYMGKIEKYYEEQKILKPNGILSLAYINRFAQYVVHISRDKNYVNSELLKILLILEQNSEISNENNQQNFTQKY